MKEAIKNKWKEVTIETVRKSIAQWKKRLNAVRQQNGGATQHIFRYWL